MDCCIGGRGILCARELFIGAGCEFIGVGLWETGGGFGAECDGKELWDEDGDELRLLSSATLTGAALNAASEQASPKTNRPKPSLCLMATVPCPARQRRVIHLGCLGRREL